MKSDPYGLRAGLLGQAQKILDHKYHTTIDTIYRKIELGILEASKAQSPEPPTVEDIIKEAEKLYKFVLTK